MCKIISVISCKGGVGKTTSTVNISSYMQMHGKRVCVVDLDPQHNLSKHFGIHPGQIASQPTIYDLFNAAINETEDEEMVQIIKQSIVHSTTVDVISSNAKLSSLETVIPTATCRERLLEYILSFIKNNYEYIFLDCHPGLDMFTLNALTASNSVLIPVEAHILNGGTISPTVKKHTHTKCGWTCKIGKDEEQIYRITVKNLIH